MGLSARVAALLLVFSCATAAHADPDESADAARAWHIAIALGLDPLIERIRHQPPPASPEEATAQIRATEQLIVALSRAALTMDATLARLQHEEYAARTAHDLIEDHHEDAVGRLDLVAILVGNGVSIVGTGMQFGSPNVGKAGDALVIGGSAVAAAFSVVALVKREVGPLPGAIETNLLAPLLGAPSTARSRYPDWIWRYLDAPLAGDSSSVRRQLIDKWTREGKLPDGHSPDAEKTLTLLTAPLRAPRPVDGQVLEDRASMLGDVRERLMNLSVDIDRLWHEIDVRRP
jgi:hypothetical protein